MDMNCNAQNNLRGKVSVGQKNSNNSDKVIGTKIWEIVLRILRKDSVTPRVKELTSEIVGRVSLCKRIFEPSYSKSIGIHESLDTKEALSTVLK